MMAAKPIIQAIDAGNNLVREADCGIDVEPDNVSEISKAILALNPCRKKKEENWEMVKNCSLESYLSSVGEAFPRYNE